MLPVGPLSFTAWYLLCDPELVPDLRLQGCHIPSDFVVGNLGVNLCRGDMLMPQHLADRFKRNPMSERDFGRIGMAAGMKNQRTVYVTEFCDTF